MKTEENLTELELLGQRIKSALGSKRFKQKELADHLGKHEADISRWVSGKSAPPGRNLVELAKVLDVTLDWLLTGKSAHKPSWKEGEVTADMSEFVFVPRYDVDVFAGAGGVVDQELAKDVLAYRIDYIRDELGISNKSLTVLTVSGNSMEPAIYAGDSLLINLADKKLTSDGVFVINYDGGLIVKRIEVRFDTETILLKSDNKEYSTQEISPDRASQLNVVGKVVLVSKRV